MRGAATDSRERGESSKEGESFGTYFPTTAQHALNNKPQAFLGTPWSCLKKLGTIKM